MTAHEVNFQRPIEALHAGIAIIHQELSMMPSLTVIENMFMGRMPQRLGVINWGELERARAQAMALIDLHVDPYAAVRDLTISQRQMIEIARAAVGQRQADHHGRAQLVADQHRIRAAV